MRIDQRNRGFLSYPDAPAVQSIAKTGAFRATDLGAGNQRRLSPVPPVAGNHHARSYSGDRRTDYLNALFYGTYGLRPEQFMPGPRAVTQSPRRNPATSVRDNHLRFITRRDADSCDSQHPTNSRKSHP